MISENLFEERNLSIFAEKITSTGYAVFFFTMDLRIEPTDLIRVSTFMYFLSRTHRLQIIKKYNLDQLKLLAHRVHKI